MTSQATGSFLLEQSLMDIWRGERSCEVRKAFVELKELPVMCQQYCNEGFSER